MCFLASLTKALTLFAACAFEDLRSFKVDSQVINGLLEPLSCLTILGASCEEMVHSFWDCAVIAQLSYDCAVII